MNIKDLHIDLDLVLSKRTSLGSLMTKNEIEAIESKALKNHWDKDTIIEYVYRHIKENITDYLDNYDFLDANVIVESDPYIVKAMQLMDMSQKDAGVLLLDKEYKYPGCWVNAIADALRSLECPWWKYDQLVLEAYYKNYKDNECVPGWEHLADVLEDYYDTL